MSTSERLCLHGNNGFDANSILANTIHTSLISGESTLKKVILPVKQAVS